VAGLRRPNLFFDSMIRTAKISADIGNNIIIAAARHLLQLWISPCPSNLDIPSFSFTN
jgi:hypothetical protein